MGEIAEMMLDGTLCEGCGDYLGSDAGFPQYCSACQSEQRRDTEQRETIAKKVSGDVAKKILAEVEKGMGAKFEPGVAEHFRKNIHGMIRGMYVNDYDLITHDGMAATIRNNQLAQIRAAERKAKKNKVNAI